MNEPIIMREEGSGTRKEAERQLRENGIEVESLNIVASIENTETIKRSVGNGMGVSVLSKLAAQDELIHERILSFSLPSQRVGRNLNIVYNRNFHLPQAVEKFIKVTREVYQNF